MSSFVTRAALIPYPVYGAAAARHRWLRRVYRV